MPTWDFKCDKCGHVKEICTNFEKVPTKCPKCNKGKLKKIFSGNREVGIDFVGPGFYVNDYGKHNWKKGKTQKQIENVLLNNKDPY